MLNKQSIMCLHGSKEHVEEGERSSSLMNKFYINHINPGKSNLDPPSMLRGATKCKTYAKVPDRDPK
jgi:hypothetical protein